MLTFLTSNLFFPSAPTSVWAPDLELFVFASALDGVGTDGPASGMSMSAMIVLIAGAERELSCQRVAAAERSTIQEHYCVQMWDYLCGERSFNGQGSVEGGLV